MKKRILLIAFFIGFYSCLFAQNNLKVVEYKLLKFNPKNLKEYTVLKG